MRAKPVPTTTAALVSQLADSIQTKHGAGAVEHDVAAASLVRHLSTKVAEDDLDSVVGFLSEALDLAKTRMRAAVDEPCESDYWFG